MKPIVTILFLSLCFFYSPFITSAAGPYDQGMIYPEVAIQTLSTKNISFAYQGLPLGAKVYLVSQFDFKKYELKVDKKAPTEGRISQAIPSKVLNLDSQSQFRLEVRDNFGAVLATSETFQTGGRNKNAPSCKIEASQYVVGSGESFTIKWSGSGAAYTIPATGFPRDKDDEQRKVKDTMKVSSSLPGIHQYGILFQASSGNQEYCDVFVEVIGSEPYGTIDDGVLSASTRKPTFTGTAVNAKQVIVIVSDHEKAGGQVWMSKPITVKEGKWSVKVSPALPYKDYDYGIELLAYDKGQYEQLVSQKTLVIE